MFKTLIAIIFAALVLSGCPRWDLAQSVVNERGATISDEEFQSLEWVYCRLPRIGAVARRYQNQPLKLYAYEIICQTHWSTD